MTEEIKLGDIVWAKIGKFPFWPSIVCIDPFSMTYVKSATDKRKKFVFHVRFFNDNSRRNWTSTIEKYSGADELLKKYPKLLARTSKNQTALWNFAVRDANKWLKFDREARLIKLGCKHLSDVSKNIDDTKNEKKTSVSYDSDFIYWKKAIIKRAEEEKLILANDATNNIQIEPKRSVNQTVMQQENSTCVSYHSRYLRSKKDY